MIFFVDEGISSVLVSSIGYPFLAAYGAIANASGKLKP
jgi:hypothetical protein